MTITAIPASPVFSGSKSEQALGQTVFSLLAFKGRSMSFHAPIRETVASLEAFLQTQDKKASATSLRKLADLNPAVFALEERNGETCLVTTRGGLVPEFHGPDLSHSFGERFLTPLPIPETPVVPLRPRQRVDSAWVALDSVLDQFDTAFESLPADPVLEELAAFVDLQESDAAVEEEIVEVVEVEEIVAARTITVTAAATTDVASVDDVDLASAISTGLTSDPRVATFGDLWMLEDRVPRFSKNELRRLKDYIEEQEQPLIDDVLVQDVLGTRANSPDFELMKFALNYRLGKEHKDFVFLGTGNQRFWGVPLLPQLGTQRRKVAEISTDYRYLLDETQNVVSRSVSSVDHLLTFYEHNLGLLPLDSEMLALLPAPLHEGQRSSVLTFDCPQAFTTYLVELRYPAPNRGGFILGLDDFFHENLVPGAMISIHATENDGHYRVEYGSSANRSERLLEIEERRQQYGFRPTMFSCAVLDDYLITEEGFSGFAKEKPMDEKARRRPDSVLARAFERIGHHMEGLGYTATFTELFAAANVERPFSEHYLRSVLNNDESGAFAHDTESGDSYTYVPNTKS